MKSFLLERTARRAAYLMVYLDKETRRAIAAGDMVRAVELWWRRERIREERSKVIRQLFRSRRTRREAPDQAVV